MRELELLRRLAAANPRVLSCMELEHGSLVARIAYEQEIRGGSASSTIAETIHLAPGFGDLPDDDSTSLRELGRHAVRASRGHAWNMTAADGQELQLGGSAVIMGVLNVTSDSFSDGGEYLETEPAVTRALQMLDAGAHWLDIGGESTRPGAPEVEEAVEVERVSRVVAAVRARTQAPISIDTSKAAVARSALDCGASLINDVTALQGDPAMAGVVAQAGAPLVLMHMQGSPRTMQEAPDYGDVVADLCRFLRSRILVAAEAGISPNKIIIDPGIGFGKSVDHNLEILRRLGEFSSLGRPVLVGASRKSFLGQVLSLDVDKRAEASAQAHAYAVSSGAAIVRVHDVEQTRSALSLTEAIQKGWVGSGA